MSSSSTFEFLEVFEEFILSLASYLLVSNVNNMLTRYYFQICFPMPMCSNDIQYH